MANKTGEQTSFDDAYEMSKKHVKQAIAMAEDGDEAVVSKSSLETYVTISEALVQEKLDSQGYIERIDILEEQLKAANLSIEDLQSIINQERIAKAIAIKQFMGGIAALNGGIVISQHTEKA